MSLSPSLSLQWRDTVCPVLCDSWISIMEMVRNDSTLICNATEILVDQGEFSYVFAVLFGIPASLIILVTVVGNFLVLCFKARVGKRQTMLLIWNLGLADFLVGIIVLPMGVITVIFRKWTFGRFLCRVWVTCDVIFCTASIVTLCIISVDRYIGVTRPLRYKLIVTKTKVVSAIVSIWFFSISILFATVKWDPEECISPEICHVGNELQYVVHSVIFAFFIPAIVTLFLYWKIYKGITHKLDEQFVKHQVAQHRERCLSQGLMIAMGDNFLKDVMGAPLRIHCGNKDSSLTQQQNVVRMHKRMAKTLGVVVSAFLCCWLPFFSLYLIGYNCGNCVPGLALDVTTWLGYCNSMINPVIYAFTIDEFRDNVKLVLRPFVNVARCCCFKGISRDQSTTSMNQPLPRSGRAYSLTPTAQDNLQVHNNASAQHKGKQPPSRSRTAESNGLGMISETEFQEEDTTYSAVEELVWSAKLYCILISPKSTSM